MLTWFGALFSETSDVSMTRFLSFICVVSAVLIALTGVLQGSDPSAIAILCATFLGAGLGAKVTQKFAEINEVNSESTK